MGAVEEHMVIIRDIRVEASWAVGGFGIGGANPTADGVVKSTCAMGEAIKGTCKQSVTKAPSVVFVGRQVGFGCAEGQGVVEKAK